MPIIKSAKKRVRVSNKATVRNSKTKRNLRSAFKLLVKSPTVKNHNNTQSAIDKTTKKGLIHKNKAARLKKQAAAMAKAAGVKTGKSVAKKVAPKKPAAKKTTKKTIKKTTKKKLPVA